MLQKSLGLFVLLCLFTVTAHHLSNDIRNSDPWDVLEASEQTAASKPFKLPNTVIPSFYRLKLIPSLQYSTFKGEVYITLKTKSKTVNSIVLHAKDLILDNSSIKLTEQIYEKVDQSLAAVRLRRDVSNPNSTDDTGKPEVTDKINEPEQNNVNSNTTTVAADVINATDLSKTSLPSLRGDNVTDFHTTEDQPMESSTSSSSVPSMTTLAENIEIPQTNIPKAKDTQVTHGHSKSLKVTAVLFDAPSDRLTISLDGFLRPDVEYTLKIVFSGQITDSLAGFYKSSYIGASKEKKTLAVTQFEPVAARSAFPCFDEPEFKAKFEISIAHPKDLTALSNMDVSSEEVFEETPGWIWTHFERSVKMSTYLVAYVLCEFKYKETKYLSKDGREKKIRVWSRPELLDNTEYALNITPQILTYYEDLFGLPYALNKLDLIAIPDFSNGAMENWGLITFRETTLLYNSSENVVRDKQHVAIDVAHELAHQWFGNLVTMKWWNDLWLNEGFATFTEYVGVNQVEPHWNMLQTLLADKMAVFKDDALKNTAPVSKVIYDAAEINQKFNDISYFKGASLICMLNHTITSKLFHKGLVHYLNKWKYGNAEENDLWEAMSEANSNENLIKEVKLVKFMNSWTKQAGYPVVNVHRSYNSNDVHLSQELFSATKDSYPAMKKQVWYIPISYTNINALESEWSTQPMLWLNQKSLTAGIDLNNTEPLYVNVLGVGYYRVNYDTRNWELLTEALRSGRLTAAISRAQLLDDAFNLAKVSLLEYRVPLELSTYLKNGENSKVVWEIVLGNLYFLKHNLKPTPYYQYFQSYVLRLISKQLETLGYGLRAPADDNEAFLTEQLLGWECLCEAPRCLRWAQSQFAKWRTANDTANNPIPSYLRTLVYQTVLQFGGKDEFDFLWDVFQKSSEPHTKSAIMMSLPSVRDEALISLLLERSITSIPNQYAGQVWAFDTVAGRKLAQDLLLSNWHRIKDRFTGMEHFVFPSLLAGSFGAITTESDLEKFKSFALKNKDDLKPVFQFVRKLVDSAELRIEWFRRHSYSIELWLRSFSGETITANTSTKVIEESTSRDKSPNTNPTESTDTDIQPTKKPL